MTSASSPDTIRFLHTSDVHVGDHHANPDSIPALVDLALHEQVDAMLVVGDLFDHNRVAQPLADSVAEDFERFERPVVILPGNHDCLVKDTIYSRLTLPPNVHLITEPGGTTVFFPELDLEIWGSPHTSYDDFTPLVGLPPRGSARWQVALAHGHFVRGAEDLRRAYLITREEIAAIDRDYLALGHWDVPHDMSAGDVTAWYSGSPSRGSVCALVTLSGVNGERRVDVSSVVLAIPERPDGPGQARNPVSRSSV